VVRDPPAREADPEPAGAGAEGRIAFDKGAEEIRSGEFRHMNRLLNWQVYRGNKGGEMEKDT